MQSNNMEEKKAAIESKNSGNVIASKILVKPWITESSTAMGEMNKYVFKIYKKCSKRQVKDAVEKTYGVKVASVNTVSIPRKARHQGKTTGWKSGFRKSIVTLKAGDSIDLFGNK